jgi:hypothetical protein
MHNTALAEWTLARFTNKPHAAAMLGDLEEASVQKGDTWFWHSYLRILLACAWRPLVAYCVLISTYADHSLGSKVDSIFLNSAKLHAPTQTQDAWLSGLSILVSMLSGVALYACMRFGLKDTLAKLSVVTTLIGIAGMAFWWQPVLRIGICVTALALFTINMSSPAGRRGMASISIMAIVQPLILVTSFFAMMVISRQFELLPSQAFVDVVIRPGVALLVCVTLGRLHRTFQEHREIA